jgi:hypothetical protein
MPGLLSVDFDFIFVLLPAETVSTTRNGSRALLHAAPRLSGHGGIHAMVLPMVATRPCAIIAKEAAGYAFDLKRDYNSGVLIVGVPDEKR